MPKQIKYLGKTGSTRTVLAHQPNSSSIKLDYWCQNEEGAQPYTDTQVLEGHN